MRERKERWRRCERRRRREVSRDVEMGGGGGGDEPPSAQLSVLPLQVGQEECQVPSLLLTQTPMHRSIMDALHWCQRKTEAERGRHGEKTKGRVGEVGEGGQQKKKATAMRNRGKGGEESASEAEESGGAQRGN